MVGHNKPRKRQAGRERRDILKIDWIGFGTRQKDQEGTREAMEGC